MYNQNGLTQLSTFYFAVLTGIVGVLAYSYFCNKVSHSEEDVINNMENTKNIYDTTKNQDIIDSASQGI